MGRRTDEQLERVVAGGGEAIQGSRFMPAWAGTLTPSEVRDLVRYVRTLSAAGAPGASTRPEPEGARVARDLGCPACHRMAVAAGPRVGPDLAAEGSRVQRAWLRRFLQRPEAIRPFGYEPLSRSRMPDFRLSDDEAAALADYLSTRRQSRLEPRAASGAAADLARGGRELFVRHACRACHALDGEGGQAGPDLSAVPGRLRPEWVFRFLLDPQAVDRASAMPRFGLAPEEARALTAFLLGPARADVEPPPPSETTARGHRLFAALGCARCHGGTPEGGDPGPDLTAAGDKLRPEWLRGFLARPSSVRPWIAARMPGFRLSARETDSLVAFLAASRDPAMPPLPERLRFTPPLAPASVEAGRRLASRAFFSCASCHVGEERPDGPPEEWAPDLRLAAGRLDPDWIVRWLLDPQRLVPGTKMPAYFSDAQSGPEEVLDGDEERQAVALRDYVLSLGPAAPAGPPRDGGPGRGGNAVR